MMTYLPTEIFAHEVGLWHPNPLEKYCHPKSQIRLCTTSELNYEMSSLLLVPESSLL